MSGVEGCFGPWGVGVFAVEEVVGGVEDFGSDGGEVGWGDVVPAESQGFLEDVVVPFVSGGETMGMPIS